MPHLWDITTLQTMFISPLVLHKIRHTHTRTLWLTSLWTLQISTSFSSPFTWRRFLCFAAAFVFRKPRLLPQSVATANRKAPCVQQWHKQLVYANFHHKFCAHFSRGDSLVYWLGYRMRDRRIGVQSSDESVHKGSRARPTPSQWLPVVHSCG